MLFPIGPTHADIADSHRIGYYGIDFSISAAEIMALRGHVDEAISDPDYAVVISYEYRWDDGNV